MDASFRISNICRLCLSEDDIIPVADVIHFTLTAELIEQFTGVQIDNLGNLSYAICLRCKNILERSAEYRNNCLNNDILFKQLFFLKYTSANDHTEEVKRNSATIQWHSSEIEFITPVTETDRTVESDVETLEQFSPDVKYDRPASSGRESDKANEHEDDDGTPNMIKSEKDTLKPNQKHGKKKELCVLCGKTVHFLSRHLNSHTRSNTFSCPHCCRKLTDQSNLMRHIRAVHQRKEIIFCQPCDRGFTSKNSYQAHMRAQHVVGETYECEICSKRFKQLSGYKKHMSQSHTDERKYSCTICGKLFKDRQVLQQHGAVHSTIRPYACGICSKQFKSRYALTTHEITHSGTTYRCSSCDKSYRYKSLLTQHIKQVHPPESSTENAS